jgi:hypothetical protein
MLPCILALIRRRKGLPRSVDEAGGEGDVDEDVGAPSFNRCKLAHLGHTPSRFVLFSVAEPDPEPEPDP